MRLAPGGRGFSYTARLPCPGWGLTEAVRGEFKHGVDLLARHAGKSVLGKMAKGNAKGTKNAKTRSWLDQLLLPNSNGPTAKNAKKDWRVTSSR